MLKKDFICRMFATMLVGFLTVGFSSCDDGGEKESVSVGMPQVSIESDGGTQVVPVTSNTKWMAVSSATWLTVTPMQGTGNGQLMLSAASNTEKQDRSAFVTLTAGEASAMIMVSQKSGGASSQDVSNIAGSYVGTLKPMGYSDQPANCYITITKLSSTTYRLTSLICEKFKIDISSGINLVATPQSDGRIQLTTETTYSVEGNYFQGTLTLSLGIGDDNFFFSGTKG